MEHQEKTKNQKGQKILLIALFAVFMALGIDFLFRVRISVADRNNDGKPDLWTHMYRGKIQKEINDRNFDGLPDEWTHYENGEVVLFEKDRNFSGKPNEWNYYHHNIPTQSIYDYNGPQDKPDQRPDVWMMYDEKGNQRQMERDTNFDGKADKRSIYIPGRIKPVRKEIDANFDGTFETVEEIP